MSGESRARSLSCSLHIESDDGNDGRQTGGIYKKERRNHAKANYTVIK